MIHNWRANVFSANAFTDLVAACGWNKIRVYSCSLGLRSTLSSIILELVGSIVAINSIALPLTFSKTISSLMGKIHRFNVLMLLSQ